MKNKRTLIAAVASFCLALAILTGCNSLQQRKAYNTIYSVEASATTIADNYFAAVVKGILPTNDVPAVKTQYNRVQAAGLLAASVAAAGTNAIAPDYLTGEFNALSNLIVTIQTKGK